MIRFSHAAAMVLLTQIAMAAYVPVSVMLPLDTITSKGFANPSQLQTWLNDLASVGTDGITVDVWWPLVETQAQSYDWTAYSQLFTMIKNANLKIQPILDFHKCGGNVGDTCDVMLPSWVLSVGNSNPDIWYKDSQGHYDNEYISLFVDHEPLFGGRTPIQIYSGFVQSFVNQFSSYFGSTIVQVEVGMGPAGEMRYPSYQLAYWNFCGVGEFQSYSSYALKSLQQAAAAIGQPSWALAGGPNNAGTYSTYLSGAPFFLPNQPNNYASPYGQFFLQWYSQSLINHGNAVLGAVAPILQSAGQVTVVGKVAGIHWWYKTASHAAECTAGYYNTNNHNAYLNIANMFANHGASMDFTCLEMLDSSQPANCDCGPQELVMQAQQGAQQAGIGFGGENALPFYNSGPYHQIETIAASFGTPMDSFSYLRLTSQLVQSSNLHTFGSFVATMHSLAMGQSYAAVTSSDDNAGQQNVNVWEIVGPIAGVVMLVGGVAVAVVVRRMSRRRSLARESQEEQLMESMDGSNI